jgi:SAM-dependent methyltransferase
MDSGFASKITSDTVRSDFNDPVAVVHYSRAAHFLGLWKSERILIERYLPDPDARILEAGCGAGRVTVGLSEMGFRNITAFDFAEELLEQAKHLAAERGATCIRFLHADATNLGDALLPADCELPVATRTAERDRTAPGAGAGVRFEAALFMFNGLMQIPGRESRRAALRELARVCAPGAPFIFTTHDRDHSPRERALWKEEAERWRAGTQDPRLVEFGDRYFDDEVGRVFMHLPDRDEILTDLADCGWRHQFDAMRREIAIESRAVRDFSDECRFWVARRASEKSEVR